MTVERIDSWRAFDDAVAAAGAQHDTTRTHASLVFRGSLARATPTLDAEGATVFTTELLAAHAPTIDALDDDGEPFVLFFEPPSLDDRIVNQSAVLSTMSSAAAGMDEWLQAHRQLWHCWLITADAKAEISEPTSPSGY